MRTGLSLLLRWRVGVFNFTEPAAASSLTLPELSQILARVTNLVSSTSLVGYWHIKCPGANIGEPILFTLYHNGKVTFRRNGMYAQGIQHRKCSPELR